MIQKSKGINVSIRPGRTGQYDVLVDGRCIFSKDEVGRFPKDDEILGKL